MPQYKIKSLKEKTIGCRVSQTNSDLILGLPLIGYVSLGKLLNVSEPSLSQVHKVILETTSQSCAD